MIRDTTQALVVVCFGFGLLCGYCAGVAVESHRDAQIIRIEREAKRLALDAAVASAVAVAPTDAECGSAAYTALDRGWALVQMEGR